MPRVMTAVLLVLLAAGCASGPDLKEKNEPAYYFQLGEEALEGGRYEEAIESFQKVRESFLSPELNTLAELKIAEAHFLAKEYLEAAAAYEEFLKQHPNHDKTAQVLFQLGLAYDRQILTPDRDQTATRNAIATFETLRQRFPGFAEREQIETMIARARETLAAHELYVGRFYLKSGHSSAAVGRLAPIPDAYPGFSGLDEVYFLLGRSYLETGDGQKAKQALATLVKRYPESEFANKAQGLME